MRKFKRGKALSRIAAGGIYLSIGLNQPWIDGASSILIGITLGFVAALLAHETKGLLIGEAANIKTRDSIMKIIAQTGGVVKARYAWA